MINNTSRGRWERLDAKNLDQQFINEMLEGLNCSPIEARAITEKVHEVYAPLFESGGKPRPGQIQMVVVDARVAPNVPLAKASQKLVTLTLDAGAEDRATRRQGGVATVRQKRLLRMAEEAFQQGGLLTLEDFAQVFNCGLRTLNHDLKALRQNQITPPLRSTVKDMGRAITHRQQIIELWLQGKEYTEIARQTHHAVESVANYVDKFRRCVALFRHGFDLATTAFLVGISKSLAKTFHHISSEISPARHRQKELDDFFKKNGLEGEQKGFTE